MSKNILQQAGFKKITPLKFASFVPCYTADSPDGGEKVVVKTVGSTYVKKFARDVKIPYPEALGAIKGYIIWEARCREILGDHLGNSYLRQGVVNGTPYIVLRFQPSTPLIRYANDPALIDAAPNVGIQMCELCLAGQEKKMKVGQFLLPNWLLCQDRRIDLIDFVGTKIDESDSRDLLGNQDCQSYLRFVEKHWNVAKSKIDDTDVLQSFMFMLCRTSYLAGVETFRSMNIELAVSQHLVNDAARAGLTVPNEIAEKIFSGPTPSWLVYVICKILDGSMEKVSKLRDELKKHLDCSLRISVLAK